MNVPSMINRKIKEAIKGAIQQLVKREYSFLGGKKVQAMFSEDILKLIGDHWRDPFHMDVGQVLWYGVHKDEKPHFGKTSDNTDLVPIVLTLLDDEDLKLLHSGYTQSEIRKYKIARLFKEAYQQNALLSNSDIAFLMHCSMSTVGKDVHKYMDETREILPTRGIVHDIGPTFTHKKMIIKLYLEGMQTPDIARKTNHTEGACDRYIKSYRRVRSLYKDRKDADFISKTLSMSRKLVQEYINLHKEMEK